MIELIEHPLSPYSQKVRIALDEKGLAYNLSIPAAIGSGQTPEAFRKANPRGEVPVLLIDGRSLFDSSIILEFLEDRFPETPLMPSDPFERARARTLEEVCDTTYEAITWGLSEIANFRRATGEQAEAMQARAGEELAALHRWLEAELGDAEWFGGSRFGHGDLCVVPFVAGAAGFGFAPPPGALTDWLARCSARPSVAGALKAARDSLAAMAGVAQVVEAGLFKRQYRDHRLEWMIRSGGLSVVEQGLARDNIRFNSPLALTGEAS